MQAIIDKNPRNFSIDILKFIAAILITNSHMDMLYPHFTALATGGQLGDGLFFFCSGFTLFLGKLGSFDNWYKRRINRIYPTVFAWAILAAFVFGSQSNMTEILLQGGGWFVSCIMMYYVVLYFVRKFMINRLSVVFGVFSVICVMVYIYCTVSGNYFLDLSIPLEVNKWITQSYFKWLYFFLFMLLGAMISISKKEWNYKLLPDFIKLLICIVLWYSVLLFGKKIEWVVSLQILGLIPLLGSMIYFYKVCNSNFMKRVYENKYSGAIIRIIGGLCLEIYLVQSSLFTSKMNGIFPVNILIMFIIIVVAAYILRCLSRIFAQTFKDADYNWKAVFSVY